MTTVGYGDKSPVTVAGRLIALVWMFAAILVISSLTASIASALTVNQLSAAVSGPDDLPKVKVGTVEPSAGLRYLQRRSIPAHGYPDARAAMTALDAGAVDAVVYEAPILEWLAHGELADRVRVLPGTFDNHGYGFGMPEGSALREPLNRALLAYIASDEWPALLARYLGGAP
jgi:ABC-type amino acid transport substrate-binding protein